MLKLPDVTLTAIDSISPALAKMSVNDCMKCAEFGALVAIFDERRLKSTSEWGQCIWQTIPQYVATSHALVVQWDSWIIDPEVWTDEFLKYDYVAAPWWYPENNVGNGGFSLRSVALMKFLHENQDKFPCPTGKINEDDVLCRTYRPELEKHGFKWPPDQLASQFSFERTRPSKDARHFGYHGMFNWPLIMPKDQLLERMKIAEKCPYIRNHHIWNETISVAPWLVQAA